MALVCVTQPTSEPITIEEALEHLRVDSTPEDFYVSGLITAARQYCENELGKSLLPTVWRQTLDGFPCGGRFDHIKLLRSPVSAVTSVTYVATDGTTKTLETSKYDVDLDSQPCRISPSYGNTWPVNQNEMNAVKITFTAGYASADLVPQNVKLAMLLLIGHWFEHRESVITGTITKEIEFAVTNLLAQERMVHL